ncbi:MAG: tetratricopeptide repeat protein [Amylibacter sp.]
MKITQDDFDTLAEAMVLYEDTYTSDTRQKSTKTIVKISRVTEGKVTPKGDIITWMKRATAEGDQYSAWDLAGAYSSGNGVKKDDAAAFHWAELDAFLGHSEARGAVVAIYVSGAIGPKKPDQGIALIARGAEHRDDASMLLLAEYYESLGAPRDLGMAWRVLDIARERGLKKSDRSNQIANCLRREGADIEGRNISDPQYNHRFDGLLSYTKDDYNAAIRNFKTRYTPFKD